MSYIIRKKVKNTTYLYEVTYYNERGKEKRKWSIKGKLDENGELIPSKKKSHDVQEAQEINALAIIETPQSTNSAGANADEPQVEPVEAEVVPNNELVQVISKKATNYKMGMSKVENTLFDEDKNPGIYAATDESEVRVNVSRANAQKRIETLLYIDFNDAKANGLTISNEERITGYDREIHNAVATLAAEGNEYISPSMIFQLLSGNVSDDRNKMSEETREKITNSLRKLRYTNVTINATAEVKAGMIAEAHFERYLIPADRAEIILNGQRVNDAIRLLATLPLFDYASKKNQVVSVDIKMLNTPLQNSPENITLKGYLLKRIMAMSNEKNNMNNVIRYDSIYQYLRVQAPNKNQLNKKHKKIRDKVKKLLDFWKKEKLIKDYKEEKEGRFFAKVTIYC